MKKYFNPSSFQSMVKSYGKELPTLTSIHHIRESYQEDPRKKRRLEEWELRKDNTQISKDEDKEISLIAKFPLN